ncbi:ubiquinone/menaquinone biosynthesis C-methyltransferase UbiE [Hypericibacter terrae]|uniref:Ubiquinone/menaquinone biosynthesis C-methyltransferase UbiE n=1 Tax=Hypericibacter terrae TaxID=2602015 RepID=A0A5J6MVC0_9PROT|nr:bifunctional demethylmenaquinone methyltransferase/2-methoxy-6-polyprenyl-1,4-benzoquinol methylase UbiE [Hypericibacter terrae]QEX20080.1 ubiquinone/menaquinone biosynthesis C-methyltransferase UbiE [Hypericibacter terrae]
MQPAEPRPPAEPGPAKAAADSPAPEAEQVSFGFRTVAAEEKAGLVRGVFDSVADRYDLMNDLMSGGIHRLWKKAMIDWLDPRPGQTILDVAGGTGDIALRILERLGGADKTAASGSRILVCDLTPAMLARGRDRSVDRGHLGGIEWIAGNAEALPLESMSVDAYTIAFGLRNVTHIDRALAEARRVLKPGGRFLCLEFSHVVLPMLDRLYDIYSFSVLPRLGRVVAKDEASYRYLAESIRRFPRQEDLAAMIEAAGLAQVRYRNLSGGIAALHSAWRL